MNYYITVLKKYAVFNGRATRSEYWYFALFNFIISIVLSLISGVIGDTSGILSMIYVLVILIPSLAVSVRRMHDIGKSGWMVLVSLIPLIGWVWFIILAATDSQADTNKYGPNPKGKESA